MPAHTGADLAEQTTYLENIENIVRGGPWRGRVPGKYCVFNIFRDAVPPRPSSASLSVFLLLLLIWRLGVLRMYFTLRNAFEDAFQFVLVPPPPGGSGGMVRTVISLRLSMILGRIRPGSGG